MKRLIEHDYQEEKEKFQKVLNVAAKISVNQHGIDLSGRGVRAVKIFTRQCQSILSLNRLLPKTPLNNSENEFWDVSTIATISRNIVEAHINLYYFGTEEICKEEAELRFLILQRHRNYEWYRLARLNNENDDTLTERKTVLNDQMEQIKNHLFYDKLTTNQQKMITTRGADKYKTRDDFISQHSFAKDLKFCYKFLSNYVHATTLSVERINNVDGRGIGSENDIRVSCISLSIARKYFAASTIEIFDRFYSSKLEIFSKEVDLIRPMLFD